MAIRVPKDTASAAFGAVAAVAGAVKGRVIEVTNADATDAATAVTLVNELKAKLGVSHYAPTEKPILSDEYTDPSQSDLQVVSADATDLATLVTLVNEIKDVYVAHGADAYAHKVADATNVVTNADATDAATAATLITEIKADLNAHRIESGVHPNNDTTNVVTNADATDQATGITLANEVKADLNAHIVRAPTSDGILRLMA